ncbi:Transposable element P transposase [Frankliniella fusca]|uniref:Transposable element P transposase n=1 Tax=Frankliniella fusca TaxID=407009 RepID=A0AAE1HVE8_9NEOP|nr:Transposable element P transposase [Frankliniella fusca]
MLERWESIISRGGDFKLKPSHTVCELHFDESLIIRPKPLIVGGINISPRGGKIKLVPHAVPTILKGYPKYMVPKVQSKRSAPSIGRGSEVPKKRSKKCDEQVPEISNEEVPTEQTMNDEVVGEEVLMINPLPLMEAIYNDPHLIQKPESWLIHRGPSFVSFVHIDSTGTQLDKVVKFSTGEEQPYILLKGQQILKDNKLCTLEDISFLLKRMDNSAICPGTELKNVRSPGCIWFLEPSGTKNKPPPRCSACFSKRKDVAKAIRRDLKKTETRRKRSQQKTSAIKNLKVIVARRETRIKKLKEIIHDLHDKFQALDEKKIQDYVAAMPPSWQTSIITCVKAAKVKNSHGRRYTAQWIYECTLLRIKSLGLYKKMLRDEFLPLPSLRTLQRYMKKLNPAYGFNQNTFSLIKEKCVHMPEHKRHGSLLLDEMKITEGLTLDKPSLEVKGFVFYGNHTPEGLKDVPADHALVLMFQGFQDAFYITVAAFLSKGAIKGPDLAKILLEAISLLEQAGLFVDCIVSDGATWNRNMWSKFGLKKLRYESEGSKKKSGADWDQKKGINFDFKIILVECYIVSFYESNNRVVAALWCGFWLLVLRHFTIEGDQRALRAPGARRYSNKGGGLSGLGRNDLVRPWKKYTVDDDDNDECEDIDDPAPLAYARPSQKNYKNQKKNPPKKRAPRKMINNSPENDEDFVSHCTHPIDSKRNLYFVSDFPHLIKSVKQRIVNTETPDGKVKLNHWALVCQEDEKRGIKVAPKLSKAHFQSESYAAMSVKLAFSFFSEQVATAMEHYKNQHIIGMEDCEATVKFIRRINVLIDFMNSNSRKDGLKAPNIQEESEENEAPPLCLVCGKVHAQFSPQRRGTAREVLTDFLAFLKKWETSGVPRDQRLSASAAYGLRVTVQTALHLSLYLIKDLGYEYFMTRRINQDALEHFFGVIRQGCGAHGHPDPVQFIQVYRLASYRTLIKPPKGSNIMGGDMLKSLLSMPDFTSEENKRRRLQFEKELDEALDTGEVIESCVFSDHTYYQNSTIDLSALKQFGGYVVRRTRKFTCARTCDECFSCLKAPADQPYREEEDDITHSRSLGYLITPSDNMMGILTTLEKTVLEVYQTSHIHKDLVFEVIDRVKEKEFTQIGCAVHKRELTKAIISFYINTRIIFACEEYNRRLSENARKKARSKQQIKMFRLTC